MSLNCSRNPLRVPVQVQMKTHFNSLSGRRLFLSGAIFFLLSGSAPLLDAKECGRVFEENKEKILSSENYVAEGCVFATGKMISRSGNREIGYSKAKLDAISNVISFLEAKVDWPKKIPAGLRKRIWAEYLKKYNFAGDDWFKKVVEYENKVLKERK